MDLFIIFSNEDAKIETNMDLEFIQVVWLKHPKSESFKEIILKAHSFANQYGLTNWLCDMRQLLFLDIADQNWLVNEIFTSFNPAQQHELAYVISELGLELMTTIRIHNLVKVNTELSKYLKVEIFFEPEIALKWLFDITKVV
ncbi:hypothetical protein [Adhaeribacter aquaticus]|uniref:hypothetical protein n=1 Tax=Adhaeribacter aquaticus TaxID=299567 RepID=UPI00042175D9|nr:hypothetical protein [Adhaeribacter aquaticus]